MSESFFQDLCKNIGMRSTYVQGRSPRRYTREYNTDTIRLPCNAIIITSIIAGLYRPKRNRMNLYYIFRRIIIGRHINIILYRYLVIMYTELHCNRRLLLL